MQVLNLFYCLYPQIESHLPLRVMRVGIDQVGDCGSGESNCKCCCTDKISIGKSWNLVDTKKTSHFGPNISITSTCRCPNLSDTSASYNNEVTEIRKSGENIASLTSAHAVTAARKNVCDQNSCYNGGKCVPTHERKTE